LGVNPWDFAGFRPTRLRPGDYAPGVTALGPRSKAETIALFALIGFGVLRICLTYPVFFQTADEPDHLGCGMHWLERTYPTGCLDQPPLARLASAVPLRLAGVHAAPDPTGVGDYGTALLRSGGRYARNLALARGGILPFFVLACLVVWAWTRRLFGPLPALSSVFLLQGLPPVLAHAGLATTDMALAALLPIAFLSFMSWLESPTLKNTALMGGAVGLTFLMKFSAVLFFPFGAFMIFAFWAAPEERVGRRRPAGRQRLGLLGLAGLMAFVIIWAGYRFQSPALASPAHRPHRVGRVVGVESWPPGLRQAFFGLVEAPIPAAPFLQGMRMVNRQNTVGHDGYFLGEVRRTGWWYFFPTLIALKTPLPFLILLLVGCWRLIHSKTDVPGWKRFAPLLAAAAILLVSIPSQINIGLRHVLPVYPFFAVVAGLGLASLLSNSHGRIGSRLLGLGLAGWFGAVSVGAHPDYLTYFNELAGGRPERIVADSDLSWGQDVMRLMSRARDKGVSSLWYRCLSCRTLEDDTLGPLPEFPPELRELEPYVPVSGWVAVDEWSIKVEGEKLRRSGEKRRAFDWLEPYPFERIGASIRLYRVPPGFEGPATLPGD
jgi:hypothetical protein